MDMIWLLLPVLRRTCFLLPVAITYISVVVASTRPGIGTSQRGRCKVVMLECKHDNLILIRYGREFARTRRMGGIVSWLIVTCFDDDDTMNGFSFS